MADEAQLKILKQGVKAWNQWRKDHSDKEIELRGADLLGALLQGADLHEANLSRSTLIGARLQGANLEGANLVGSSLGQANLSHADITGVYLYCTARDDWNIENITCDYVFLKDRPYFFNNEQRQKWEAAHRTPKDRDFRPGEFEELYRQLPQLIYYFEQGFTPIEAVVMERVVQAINEQHPEFELKLTTLDSRGQPHATFTVMRAEYVETAQQQIATDYETQIKVLEGQRDQANNLLREFMTILLSRPQIGELIIGNSVKKIATGRDYLEQIGGNAQVTTGNSGQVSEITTLDQLKTKEALQQHYQLLSEKINALRKDSILATDTEVKFKLKHQIQEAEAFLEQIEQKLDALERKEVSTNKE
jgi:hypothetical protein